MNARGNFSTLRKSFRDYECREFFSFRPADAEGGSGLRKAKPKHWIQLIEKRARKDSNVFLDCLKSGDYNYEFALYTDGEREEIRPFLDAVEKDFEEFGEKRGCDPPKIYHTFDASG